jgi:hypothetical protein
MQAKSLVIGLLMGLTAALASAQEPGILLSMTVEKNDQVIAKPRLLTKSDSTASMQRDQDLRIEVTPTDKEGMIHIAMKVYTAGADGLKVIATPRLITKRDVQSTIEFQAPGEPRYKISFVASSHVLGAPLPATQ